MSDETADIPVKKKRKKTGGTDPTKISPLMESFCQHFARTKNVCQASLAAGYKEERHGFRLLHQPKIKKRVAEITEELYGPRLQQLRDMVLEHAPAALDLKSSDYRNPDGSIKNPMDFTETANRALDVVIKIDDDTGETKTEYSSMKKAQALGLLSKITKLESPGDTTVNITNNDITKMSREELLKIIEDVKPE